MIKSSLSFGKAIRPAVLWALLILLLCGLPGNSFPKLSFLDWLRPDKIVHLVLFGTQCFLCIRSFVRQPSYLFLKKHAQMLSVLISISYGVLVEVMQSYIFLNRSGDVRDALANALGAVIGLWLYRRTAGLKKSTADN